MVSNNGFSVALGTSTGPLSTSCTVRGGRGEGGRRMGNGGKQNDRKKRYSEEVGRSMSRWENQQGVGGSVRVRGGRINE